MKAWDLAMSLFRTKVELKPSFYSTCVYCGCPLPANRSKYCSKPCQTRYNNTIRPKTRKGRAEIVREVAHGRP